MVAVPLTTTWPAMPAFLLTICNSEPSDLVALAAMSTLESLVNLRVELASNNMLPLAFLAVSVGAKNSPKVLAVK